MLGVTYWGDVRFEDLPQSIVDYIQSIDDLDQLHPLLQKAIAISSLDEFTSLPVQ